MLYRKSSQAPKLTILISCVAKQFFARSPKIPPLKARSKDVGTIMTGPKSQRFCGDRKPVPDAKKSGTPSLWDLATTGFYTTGFDGTCYPLC